MKDSGASSIPAGSEPSGYVYASLWRMPQRIDCEPNGITIRQMLWIGKSSYVPFPLL